MTFLLCLNLRQEHVQGVAPAAALSELARMLALYRANAWPVFHAHTVQPRRRQHGYGALAGFEPAAKEAVFSLHESSALSAWEIAEALRVSRAPGRLAGGVYSRCGLATLLAAQELRSPLRLVREACFAPSVESVPSDHVHRLEGAEAAPAQAEFWGTNVICLETRRP